MASGLLLAAGLLTPAPAALIAATMLVAARAQQAGMCPWITAGGWEWRSRT